jgi:hypothetical protein
MRLRNSGTSSATYLLMFMSRSVRIRRYTCNSNRHIKCDKDPCPHPLAKSAPAQGNCAGCWWAEQVGHTKHRKDMFALPTSLLSGLARLEAPAVRRTLRMFLRPKS